MSEFTPLSELEGYDSGLISCRVTLPEYVPTGEIGLNVPRIERLAQIAGLDHLRIETKAGDTTAYQASVVGSDSQGNAYAGMSAVESKADIENASVHNPDGIHNLYYSYFWGDGKITVNTSEISDRIIKGRIEGGSLRSSRAWSCQLDKAVRAGIRQSASDQLIGNVPVENGFSLGAITVVGVVYAMVFDHASMSGYVGELGLMYGANQGVNALLARTEFGLPLSERRLSLIPGYQVDRLAVVHGLTRAFKVVKKIS